MASSDRIKEAMETLLKIFKEDNLEKVARAVFRGGDIPADKWSFLNRVLMYLNETDDARGFSSGSRSEGMLRRVLRPSISSGP
jgi:hypothetical protein